MRPPAHETPAALRGRDAVVRLDHVAPRARPLRPAPDLETVVGRVVRAAVHGRAVDDADAIVVADDEAGVRADRDRALARVEPDKSFAGFVAVTATNRSAVTRPVSTPAEYSIGRRVSRSATPRRRFVASKAGSSFSAGIHGAWSVARVSTLPMVPAEQSARRVVPRERRVATSRLPGRGKTNGQWRRRAPVLDELRG